MKTVYYFSAEWCAPCKKVYPLLMEVAAEYPDLTIEYIDIEKYATLAEFMQIQAVPQLVYNNTKVILTPAKSIIRKALEDVASSD
jgi:thioredoxin 1